MSTKSNKQLNHAVSLAVICSSIALVGCDGGGSMVKIDPTPTPVVVTDGTDNTLLDTVDTVNDATNDVIKPITDALEPITSPVGDALEPV
ncbi:hypothetical protein, partial [Methylobacillus rhizosphaerae]